MGTVSFVALGIAELLIPIWAERSGRPTPWHPEHIAERYGLFTIIVLGECVLAASTAVQLAIAAGGISAALIGVAFGGLVLVFSLWWSYFKHPAEIALDRSLGTAFAWGYGHYVVFAALAALGAGLQVAADATHLDVALTPDAVALSVAVPLAIYLGATAILHARSASRRILLPIPLVVALVLLVGLAAPWVGVPPAIVVMGLLVAGLVAFNVATMRRAALLGVDAA